MVLGALVMPVTAPLVIGFTLGLDLSVVQLFIDLVINFAAAIAIALVVRLAAGTPRLKRRTAELDGLMAILMVAFIVAVMSDVGRELAEDWRRVGKFLVAVLAANFGLQTLIAVIVMAIGGRPRFLADRRSGLTIALMSGNRNMALIIAALPASAAEPFLLFLALYQLPIYATPLLMGRSIVACATRHPVNPSISFAWATFRASLLVHPYPGRRSPGRTAQRDAGPSGKPRNAAGG